MIEILEWIALLSLPAFLLLDLVYRAQSYDAPRRWRLRALLVTVFTLFFATQVGEWWGGVLGGGSLVDGAALGTLGGAAVGILVYELVHYLYHRAAHRFDPLWRVAHQVHHSAESLDVYGANYAHPVDTLVFATLPVLVLIPLLGVTPEAVAIVAAFLAFNATFQHANIKTPRWLGYLIQRPESHSLHHGRGVHRYNYSDLPLWDMLFGTFRNPRDFVSEQGFYKGASAKLGAMLLGQDVSQPPAPDHAAVGHMAVAAAPPTATANDLARGKRVTTAGSR